MLKSFKYYVAGGYVNIEGEYTKNHKVTGHYKGTPLTSSNIEDYKSYLEMNVTDGNLPLYIPSIEEISYIKGVLLNKTKSDLTCFSLVNIFSSFT